MTERIAERKVARVRAFASEPPTSALLLVLICLLSVRALTPYSGAIWTRPVFVQGVPANCPNYLQGADTILRTNGDVDNVFGYFR